MGQGLPEPLFERLTSSPAEPHLQGLKELFLNYNGKLWTNRTPAVIICPL